MKSRVAWGLAVALAVAVVCGIGLLIVQLRFYWVAKYRGEGADLSGVVHVFAPLEGAQLWEADLSGANLHGAHLRKAVLGAADLSGADLSGADLVQAFMPSDLSEADLTGADMREAEGAKTSLPNAILVRADLTGAILGGADLSGANLTGASLRSANLLGADLTGADLSQATLIGARYDAHTRWPAGFDPRRHGQCSSSRGARGMAGSVGVLPASAMRAGRPRSQEGLLPGSREFSNPAPGSEQRAVPHPAFSAPETPTAIRAR
jgi:hypothetical protein